LLKCNNKILKNSKFNAKIKVQSAEYYEKSIHKLLIDYRVKEGRANIIPILLK
tara:strand:- start:92 stop:250 length:159 start_codon:yes stop_codon:yes gene_type:complete